jgi:hypothetical protein
MQERFTIPADPEQMVTGYIVNSGVSEGLYRQIDDIQTRLNERFPGAIWIAPRDSLHITLMDWLAPLVDYGEDKDELFHSIENRYIEVLAEALEGQRPIQVTFDTIEVYPAAIIAKGHDDGSYQRIRESFLEKVELLPGTKQPPKIIHATICKFLKKIDVSEVEDFVRQEPLRFQEEVSDFRLARESQIFMLTHEVLRRFTLR